MKNKCLCGCDNEVNEGKKWLSGHNRKGNKISPALCYQQTSGKPETRFHNE